MPTDIQYKDELRKEKIMYNDYLELLSEGKLEKLKQRFEAEIERIEATLQD